MDPLNKFDERAELLHPFSRAGFEAWQEAQIRPRPAPARSHESAV
jgi:hypothetical protein